MVVNDKNNPKESIVKLNTNPLGGRISLSVKIMGSSLCVYQRIIDLGAPLFS